MLGGLRLASGISQKVEAAIDSRGISAPRNVPQLATSITLQMDRFLIRPVQAGAVTQSVTDPVWGRPVAPVVPLCHHLARPDQGYFRKVARPIATPCVAKDPIPACARIAGSLAGRPGLTDVFRVT